MAAPADADCPGCAVRARLAPAEVERLVAAYFAEHPQAVRAGEGVVAARLARCAECADLLYGVSCRHCGCLVAARARLATAACPRPAGPRW